MRIFWSCRAILKEIPANDPDSPPPLSVIDAYSALFAGVPSVAFTTARTRYCPQCRYILPEHIGKARVFTSLEKAPVDCLPPGLPFDHPVSTHLNCMFAPTDDYKAQALPFSLCRTCNVRTYRLQVIFDRAPPYLVWRIVHYLAYYIYKVCFSDGSNSYKFFRGYGDLFLEYKPTSRPFPILQLYRNIVTQQKKPSIRVGALSGQSAYRQAVRNDGTLPTQVSAADFG